MYAPLHAPSRLPYTDLAAIRRPRPLPRSARRARKAVLGVGTFMFMAVVLAQSAHGSSQTGWDTVRVQPGQSLWGIAAERYPDADTRSKVGEIMQANRLSSPQISPGEVLKVPAS